ncbi:MAG: hypothetical protein E3J45_06375 [Candidatus Zixiibacteriota bacterium]|nr:MAG: hypothetical protein E3J45_06375 [candidate division Zixibacteria bacterium]
MSKLSSLRLGGAVVLLSLLAVSFLICPAVAYAGGDGSRKGIAPDGGGREYYGTESAPGGGGFLRGEEQGPPSLLNSSPQELLLQIYLVCQFLGLSL